MIRILLAGFCWLVCLGAMANPPAAPREFRGMWIATVWNIDWPSRPGISVEQMQNEMQELIRSARQAGMNAVVIQVRSYSDAIYPSRLDPWSEFVTGQMGRAPAGGFDPLQFAVDECRRNGLLLHCWVNPFRAGVSTTVRSDFHISRRYPEVVRRIGTRLWADPGEPVARRHALDVVRDLVTRYDIDGIHYDDKGFYPYPAELRDWGQMSEFPDEESFRRHGRGFRNRGDWRRNNITTFIQESERAIRGIKPHVMFGVSPFGIHRAGEPPGIVGTSAHDVLFTDCKTWMQRGLVDYMAPQLYWEISSRGQPFEPLARWWSQENRGGKHMWPGIWTDKYSPQEIVNKIAIMRQIPGIDGHIHYTGRAIRNNKGGVRTALRNGPYASAALPPLSPWLGRTAPPPPQAVAEPQQGGAMRLRVQRDPRQPPPHLYAIYVQSGQSWTFATMPGINTTMTIPATGGRAPRQIFLAAVDRLGNESARVPVSLRP